MKNLKQYKYVGTQKGISHFIYVQKKLFGSDVYYSEYDFSRLKKGEKVKGMKLDGLSNNMKFEKEVTI